MTELERLLSRLLLWGTIACSIVIALGVLAQSTSISTPKLDLVSIGIVGFILLPVARLLAMLVVFARIRFYPMVRVVALVLCLVLAGLVAGSLI